jgi:YrbI family 3-deoxy-D-manno-octulosonate 8-phosphate phosphatase
LRNRGIKIAIITSEKTQIVANRAKKLAVDYLYQGVNNKLEIMDEICQIENIGFDQIAYIGDDINDLKILEQVGLSVSPKDGISIIKKKSNYVCKVKGGEGVLREVADMIISFKQ